MTGGQCQRGLCQPCFGYINSRQRRALLVCTAVVVMQVSYFMHKDVCFTKEAVVTVNIPRQDAEKLNTFRQQLLKNPNIKDLSYASGVPTSTGSHYGTDFRLRQEAVSMMRSAEMKVVDLQYKGLYNLQLAADRWLNATDTVTGSKNGINVFVVNETPVKCWG